MAALKRHWDYLKKNWPKLLKGLDAHYLNENGAPKSPYYKLVAGPVGLLSQARSICSDLQRASIECTATRFNSASSLSRLHTAVK